MYVFCAISKKERLKDICETITTLETNGEPKNVVLAIDNPHIKDIPHIRCASLVILRTSDKEVEETRFSDTSRRERIAHLWKVVQRYFKKKAIPKDEYLLIIEDDGEIESNSYTRLKEVFIERNTIDTCGFVSGVEAGRWRYKIIGAWLHTRYQLQTVHFQECGVIPVTSAGTYLMLTKVSRFLSYKPKFDIYFGHDVYFGIALERLGYYNYIDYSLKVKHINNGNVIEVDRQCVEVFYKYIHSTWMLIDVKGVNQGI